MKRRFNAINHTVLAYTVAVAAVVYVLTNTTIADAILNFCLGGIIPGTSVVLAPDVVIMSVIAILGLSLAGALVALLLRLVSLRHFRETSDAEADEEASEEVIIYDGKQERSAFVNNVPASTSKQVKKATKSSAVPVVSTTADRRLARIRHGIIIVLLQAERAINRVLDRILLLNVPHKVGAFLPLVATLVLRELLATWRLLVTVVSKTTWFMARLTLRIVAVSIVIGLAAIGLMRRVSASTWKYLQPYAYRLDTWLELQCRTALFWLRRKLQQYEFFQMAVVIFRDIRLYLRRVFK